MSELKKVAIIGGGFYGASIAAKLAKGKDAQKLDITLFTLRDFLIFYPAVPRLITGDFKAKDVTQSFAGNLDKSIKVSVVEEITDFDDKSVSYKTSSDSSVSTENFDFIVVATGSKWSDPIDFSKLQEKTLEGLDAYTAKFTERIAAAKKIVIVGGGDVGCELMGELAHKYGKEKELHLVHSEDKLLNSKFIDSTRKAALNSLQSQGALLHLGAKAELDDDVSEQKTLKLSNGETIENIDVLLRSTGPKPNVPPTQLDFVDDKGFVKIKSTFQSSNYPNIFALGDIVSLSFNSLTVKDGIVAVIVSNISKLALGSDDVKNAPDSITATYSLKPIGALSLGPASGTGQAKVPVLGHVKLPGFIITRAKSKNLLTNIIKDTMV